VLRLYAEVGAEGSPALYGTGFVLGQNPFRASAQVGASIGFADVIVPPAGSGAPNVGDPTTIKAVFRLDCVESDLVRHDRAAATARGSSSATSTGSS
jgi:hypothetical protein